jgi:hypothetical protein
VYFCVLYVDQLKSGIIAGVSGILKKLFETMYNENVISEVAFANWDRDTRIVFPPAEHEMSRQSVVPFFTWLREADDDVD